MPENAKSTWRPKRTTEERLRAIQQVRSLPIRNEKAFKEISAQFGVSVRTLYRWIHRFDENGIEGLRDLRRSDAGVPRMPRILRFAQASLLVLLKRAEGWNGRAIHRHLKREWPRLHPGFARPSYGMVLALIRWIEKARTPKVQP